LTSPLWWLKITGVQLMNVSVVVAICATVIAVLSLIVAIYEARAARRHDRISVRPFLDLRAGFPQGRTAGLRLINSGLGPAVITGTVLTVDGEPLGEFGAESVDRLRGKLSVRPAAVTFHNIILAADYDEFLLSIEPFDRGEHAEFADLLRHRLGLEIRYESLYGGEGYVAERKPHPRVSPESGMGTHA
jgi:hypothetical protein